MQENTRERYALIGAGPSGLAGARNLDRYGVPFDGFESHSDVGGLWDIDNPRSTVYRSAHLISSKTTTQFTEFPMAESVPDYPGHAALADYFRAYADEFGLRERFRFGTDVVRAEPADDGWVVTTRDHAGTETTSLYAGVIAANGTLATPHVPDFAGEFTGEFLHTARYKDPTLFAGKRVLVIGAGNSGCDIAVDAVHHAASVDLSVRRGYHFVPKYMFGRPADTLTRGRPLPPRIKQRVDALLLAQFTGDPTRFGLPAPDHRLYESHPVVNSLILHHLGHGDVRVRADIERFEGAEVRFVDGAVAEYDIVVSATGYRLDYPFLDRAHLSWTGDAPPLFLNLASPRHRNLFVLGMVEASGLGWQGRFEQAELVAKVIAAQTRAPGAAKEFARAAAGPPPDLSGGYRYVTLRRMAYYVEKNAYRRAVRAWSERIPVGPA
ncbi:NAD(P)-binding domain-containing protein [Rhodococcus sp. HNM0569]|uniref:flavin-containing monooxygenase n=1 Tax=Rhodococcus sp. HNM0569 TaxID=2716340 RepID=UPI00146E3A27|nr:NAD(P)-binding domain-containing protein [Rhodococcus sp. HNM0569]NLU83062.1 NAD(P)-binding domain-containing protein [Rhodococcus sp. HNM0569]